VERESWTQQPEKEKVYRICHFSKAEQRRKSAGGIRARLEKWEHNLKGDHRGGYHGRKTGDTEEILRSHTLTKKGVSKKQLGLLGRRCGGFAEESVG